MRHWDKPVANANWFRQKRFAPSSGWCCCCYCCCCCNCCLPTNFVWLCFLASKYAFLQIFLHVVCWVCLPFAHSCVIFYTLWNFAYSLIKSAFTLHMLTSLVKEITELTSNGKFFLFENLSHLTATLFFIFEYFFQFVFVSFYSICLCRALFSAAAYLFGFFLVVCCCCQNVCF